MKQSCVTFIVCMMMSLSALAADWNVTSGSFTNADNWLPVGVPGVGGTALIANGGTAQLDGGIVTNLAAIALGTVASNSAGTIEMSTGELSAGLLTVGGLGTGTVIQTGGKLTKMGNGGDWRLGEGASGVGSYSLSDGTLDTGGSNFQIGGWGKGYLTQTSGTLNSGQWPVVGRYPGSTGSYALSGGLFNQTAAGCRLIVGEEGTGTFTVSGSGVAELSGGLSIGHTAFGIGIVTLSTNGQITTPIVHRYNNNGNGTFNFDGGTLRARGNGVTLANFMQGLTAVNVKAGGVTIDSSNNVVTIAQNLLDGGGAGGLTKLGTGFLTLSGANAYSGNTMVSNGVLSVSKASALPGYDLPGKVSVNSGAGLVVGVGGAGQWSTTEINALMANATFGADSSFGFDTTGGNYTNSADISYPLGLLKIGPNTLKLSGNNTYTGSTIVYGGILQADFGTGLPNTTNVTLNGGTLSSASGSITAALGTAAGQINLVSGTPHGFSAFNTPLSVNVGGSAATLQWGSTLFNPTPLLLNETSANSELTLVNGLDLNGGSRTMNVNVAGTSATITGNISNSTGIGALTKGGAGALTLTGTNVYTGATTVNDGTLALASTSSNYLGAVTINNSATMTITNTASINSFAGALTVAGAGRLNVSGPTATVGAYDLVVGNANGTRGVATVSTNLSVRYMKIGTGNPSAGAVYLTGGTLANVGGATAGSIDIGESGYGYFRQTGGTFTGNEISVGYNTAGYGVFTLDGGTFAPTANLYLFCGRNGGTGYIHVNDGELIAPANFGISWNNLAGRGEVNVNGGLLNAAAGGFRFMGSTASSILNLRGGVLRTTTINKTATGPSYLNLHGGKLLASANLQNLIQNLSGAYVYPGGAVIDTTNVNVKIPQPLLAPTGNGVTSIPLTGNGAGYIGEPVVQFTGGGGTGATARALVNLPLGTVTAIQITNPGFGYTSAPTVTLAGGGYTSAATLGTVSIGASASGGLTKLGSGMLTLTATNTYTGVTSISNGVLALGVATALPTTADINVAGGTYDLSGFSVTNGAVTLESGSIINGTLSSTSYNLTGSGSVLANLIGNATLTKSGSGSVVLAGANAYTGETRVEAGSLILAPLSHRWSFNGDMNDSIGGRTAVRYGTTMPTLSSTNVTLAGGGKGTSWIALGANILPTNNMPVTIELWATQNAVQNWSRIFDFGNGTGNYILMSWTRGTDLNTDRVEVKSPSVTTTWDSTMKPYTLGVQYHISLVITPGAGTGGSTLIQWYKMDAAGVTINTNSFSTTWTLALLDQINMWLGHSQYGDNDASASYNEVRIWNTALTQAQLVNNSLLGPDVLPGGDRLPSGTQLTLAANTAVDLGGGNVSMASLTGSGLVTNGTIAVTGAVAPGGIGSLNTLTIAGTPTLTGTLRIDVATDGTSDLLNVQGSLNLSGLALQIESLSSLRSAKVYKIATFTPGQLTGKFESNNLAGTGMDVVYDNVAGEIRIISVGTMISFM